MTTKSKFSRWYGRAMVLPLLVLAACGDAGVSADDRVDPGSVPPSAATLELQSINQEFDRQLVKVAENVHVAIGYGASTISFIEGDEGIILVDAGQMVESSKAALAAYREISDKPISTLILTHSHGDHVNGARGLIGDGADVQIWAADNYGSESRSFAKSNLTINRLRGVRQAGFRLPPEKRINNGVAPAVYPGPGAFNPKNPVKPNQTVTDRIELTANGIDLELVLNEGETSDQLYVWYGKEGIVFAGDNFYKSWPNLYAIRGTPYRDVKKWGEAADRMLKLNANVLVGGHTLPITGADQVSEALTAYRDGIFHIFEKTIEGMNLGMTPDQLVEYAKLPDVLAQNRILRPYYGNPDWAVRSIFNGYLGWFDGNPTNLFPLSGREEANRMALLVGGVDQLSAALQDAKANKDYQWACQLADYLLAIDPDDANAKLLKAQALDALAETQVTATARNYYFTSAAELKSSMQE